MESVTLAASSSTSLPFWKDPATGKMVVAAASNNRSGEEEDSGEDSGEDSAEDSADDRTRTNC